MDPDERPKIRALVAHSTTDGLFTEPRVVSLEQAVDYARYGFVVLIDPADECDLATWERHQRSGGVKWFERE